MNRTALVVCLFATEALAQFFEKHLLGR